MKLLALDLATKVGWACGSPNDAEVAFGTHVLPSTGEDIGKFAAAFEQWLCAKLDEEKPSLLVFEAPILNGGDAGGTAVATARKLMGLAYHAELICFQRKVKVREGNLMTVKKFFAGSGRAKKQDMIAAARKYGWQVTDDNQADALGLWAHTIDRLTPACSDRFRLGLLGARA